MLYCKLIMIGILFCFLIITQVHSSSLFSSQVPSDNSSKSNYEDLIDKNCIENNIEALIILSKVYFKIGMLREHQIYFNIAIELIESIKIPELKTHLNLRLSKVNLELNDYDTAINILIRTKLFLCNSNETDSYLYITELLGTICYRIDRFDEALNYYNEGYEICKNINEIEYMAIFQYHKGYALNALCKYDLALECAFASLEILNSYDNKVDKARTHTLIASIFSDLKNFQKALVHEKTALNLKKNKANNFLIANSLMAIGNCFYHLNVLDSAYIYFNRALNLERIIGFNSGIAICLNRIGKVYSVKGIFNSALKSCREGYFYAKIANDKYVLSEISNSLAEIYMEIGILDSSQFYLDHSLEIGRTIKAKDLVMNSYLSYAKFYQKLVKYKQAYDYLEKYISLNDSLILYSTQKITEMQLRYETKRRKKEKEILQSQINIQQLELERANLIYFMFGLIIISIIGSLAFLWYLYKQKSHKSKLLESRINRAIEKQKEQHQIIVHQASLSSLGTITAALAHEINQPLQNLLLSADSIKAELENDKSLSNDIKSIYTDINRIYNTVHHVRCFSSMQKESVDDIFSINQSIKDAYLLVKRRIVKSEISVNFHLSPDLPNCFGNHYKFEQVILNLFINAIDALEQKNENDCDNSKKTINIKTKYNNILIIVVFSDNGIGIDRKYNNKIFKPFFSTKSVGEGTGLGLSIAKSIVEEMGGILAYLDEDLENTTFEIKMPFANSEDPN